jgi:hypothetical protein
MLSENNTTLTDISNSLYLYYMFRPVYGHHHEVVVQSYKEKIASGRGLSFTNEK